MAKRLIGYAVTDSNGVGVLNYIGQGLGELSVTAETGGEVLFADRGVTGDKNNNWLNYSTRLTVSTDSTGTLLTGNTSTNGYYFVNNGAFSYTTWICEFDVVSYSPVATGIAFYVQQETNGNTYNRRINFSDYGVVNGSHIKIEYDGSKFYINVDGVDKTPITASYTNHEMGFVVNSNSTARTLKFKNFLLYKGDTQLVSEPYTLLDCLFYDGGVTGNTNSDWYNVSNRLTVTVGSDGTLLEATTGNNGYYFANLNGTSTGSVANVRDYTAPICVETDIVDVDTTQISTSDYYGFMFNDGTDHRIPLGSISTTATHYKIILNGTNAVCYADTLTEPVTLSCPLSGNFAISMVVRGDSYLKYKDFKVYPI